MMEINTQIVCSVIIHGDRKNKQITYQPQYLGHICNAEYDYADCHFPLSPLSGRVPYVCEAVCCGGGPLPLGPEYLCSCVSSRTDNAGPWLTSTSLSFLIFKMEGNGNVDLTTMLKQDRACDLVQVVDCQALKHF